MMKEGFQVHVGPRQDMLNAQPPDEGAQKSGCISGMGHGTAGKAGVQVGTHILYAEFFRDFCRVRHPVDTARSLEPLEMTRRMIVPWLEDSVVNDETQIGPVSGGLPHNHHFFLPEATRTPYPSTGISSLA